MPICDIIMITAAVLYLLEWFGIGREELLSLLEKGVKKVERKVKELGLSSDMILIYA